MRGLTSALGVFSRGVNLFFQHQPSNIKVIRISIGVRDIQKKSANGKKHRSKLYIKEKYNNIYLSGDSRQLLKVAPGV